MEVDVSKPMVTSVSRQEELLYASLKSSNETSGKFESIALTMETLFKNDQAALVRLLEFYRSSGRVQMAANLLTNQLLNRLDPNNPTNDVFDVELFSFARSIATASHDFHSSVFSQLPEKLQEKLLVFILDRLKSGQLAFLKTFSSGSTEDKPTAARAALTTAEIADFYKSLGKSKSYLVLMRDLLVRQPKFIHDYGLFMIDAFLNAEKHAFLSPSSASDQQQIERRSLNVMRRVCVVELIPVFVHLIDKLDNRHCYRWIEKSLEFFTKYTIAAIRVGQDTDFIYSSISLVHNKDVDNASDSEVSLGELAHYAYSACLGSSTSPFYAIYTLLDELAKKLDWPMVVSGSSELEIEQRLSRLFEMKSKTDSTAKSAPSSALNKQISFYGLAFFFQKLVEFQCAAQFCFNSSSAGLVMAPLFELASKQSEVESAFVCSSNKPIAIDWTHGLCQPAHGRLVSKCLTSLACALELWRKFNQHKEWMTIIVKCLNNSKSDGIGAYKSFIADYYSSYVLTTANAVSLNLTWSALVTTLSLKRRISLIAYLFVNEKASFKVFF